MGKASNESVTARQRAREKLAALNADRVAKDKRIEDATTDVLAALDRQAEADDAHASAVAAARATFDAAVAKADAARDRTRAGHDGAVTAAVAALRADGVSVADIADLTGLARADVTRRGTPATTAPAATAETQPAVAEGAASTAA
ncbi:hypothetical protein H4P1_00005 (plasmid) [Variovorax sp. PBS-H4]|uniref:hypothetical protein n=1 Tax=Variovorax sp. PBS-H4 TaxID=434008 RepID=UPI0013184D5C|nr:hypothetical protein [Variovorax sp. PBS-H4]VTU41373.1 hypothetical protein H4P1_00005 [Variovorax sp. PBS-H4]